MMPLKKGPKKAPTGGFRHLFQNLQSLAVNKKHAIRNMRRTFALRRAKVKQLRFLINTNLQVQKAWERRQHRRRKRRAQRIRKLYKLLLRELKLALRKEQHVLEEQIGKHKDLKRELREIKKVVRRSPEMWRHFRAKILRLELAFDGLVPLDHSHLNWRPLVLGQHRRKRKRNILEKAVAEMESIQDHIQLGKQMSKIKKELIFKQRLLELRSDQGSVHEVGPYKVPGLPAKRVQSEKPQPMQLNLQRKRKWVKQHKLPPELVEQLKIRAIEKKQIENYLNERDKRSIDQLTLRRLTKIKTKQNKRQSLPDLPLALETGNQKRASKRRELISHLQSQLRLKHTIKRRRRPKKKTSELSLLSSDTINMLRLLRSTIRQQEPDAKPRKLSNNSIVSFDSLTMVDLMRSMSNAVDEKNLSLSLESVVAIVDKINRLTKPESKVKRENDADKETSLRNRNQKQSSRSERDPISKKGAKASIVKQLSGTSGKGVKTARYGKSSKSKRVSTLKMISKTANSARGSTKRKGARSLLTTPKRNEKNESTKKSMSNNSKEAAQGMPAEKQLKGNEPVGPESKSETKNKQHHFETHYSGFHAHTLSASQRDHAQRKLHLLQKPSPVPIAPVVSEILPTKRKSPKVTDSMLTFMSQSTSTIQEVKSLPQPPKINKFSVSMEDMKPQSGPTDVGAGDGKRWTQIEGENVSSTISKINMGLDSTTQVSTTLTPAKNIRNKRASKMKSDKREMERETIRKDAEQLKFHVELGEKLKTLQVERASLRLPEIPAHPHQWNATLQPKVSHTVLDQNSSRELKPRSTSKMIVDEQQSGELDRELPTLEGDKIKEYKRVYHLLLERKPPTDENDIQLLNEYTRTPSRYNDTLSKLYDLQILQSRTSYEFNPLEADHNNSLAMLNKRRRQVRLDRLAASSSVQSFDSQYEGEPAPTLLLPNYDVNEQHREWDIYFAKLKKAAKDLLQQKRTTKAKPKRPNQPYHALLQMESVEGHTMEVASWNEKRNSLRVNPLRQYNNPRMTNRERRAMEMASGCVDPCEELQEKRSVCSICGLSNCSSSEDTSQNSEKLQISEPMINYFKYLRLSIGH